MATEEEFVLDGETIWPRTTKERYGIFRVKNGGRPELVGTCRTQSAVGTWLCRLGAEGEFLNYCVGIMDGRDHQDASGKWIGKWLVLPWQEKKENNNG
jgi:hypothetical protein